jgi:hypothetical protein
MGEGRNSGERDLLLLLRAAMSGSAGCWCAECLRKWVHRIDCALDIPAAGTPSPEAPSDG